MTKGLEIGIASGFIIIFSVESVKKFISYDTWGFRQYGFLLFFIFLCGLYVIFVREKVNEIKKTGGLYER